MIIAVFDVAVVLDETDPMFVEFTKIEAMRVAEAIDDEEVTSYSMISLEEADKGV